MKINEFKSEVCEQLKFYVYRLIDPRNGQTFYVGKGENNRAFSHLNGKCDSREELFCDVSVRKEENENQKAYLKAVKKEKDDIIKAIKEDGKDVKIVIHRHGLDEDTAYTVEGALIDSYNEINQELHIENQEKYIHKKLSNIQGGHGNSNCGMATVEEIHRKYGLPILDETEVSEYNYIIIKVGSKSEHLQNCDQKSDYLNARYEATRQWWRINPQNATRIYALSVTNGIIEDVYWIEKWEKHADYEKNKRRRFVGAMVEQNIREKFINKRLPDKYITRIQNPIMYKKG